MRSILLFLAAAWLGVAQAGVDVNAASATELEALPGIGASKAAAIVAYRDEHGAFASVEQLDDVPGIGPATVENLRPHVELGGEVAAPAPASGGGEPGEDAAPSASAIDINTASASELEALPGIGPSKAGAIVADREANGPFASCDDLARVKGIGSATVANMGAGCAVIAP